MKTEFETLLMETALTEDAAAVDTEQMKNYMKDSTGDTYFAIESLLKKKCDPTGHTAKLQEAAFDAHWDALFKN